MKVEIEDKDKKIKLVIPKLEENKTKQGSYCVELNSKDIEELYDKLASLTTKEIINNTKTYHDDISTYANEVERTLTIGGSKGKLRLDLICYTDKDDDNWISLSPKRLARLAGLIYPYI